MSKEPAFFISLPRSATAWASELLYQTGHSFAFHEAAVDLDIDSMRDPSTWRSLYEGRGEQNVIDCNSGALSVYDKFMKEYGKCKMVLCTRDPVDAFKSYSIAFGDKFGGSLSKIWALAMDGYRRAVSDFAKSNNQLRIIVSMNDLLSKPKTAMAVCEHLAPKFSWDEQRYQLLRRKRITQYLHA